MSRRSRSPFLDVLQQVPTELLIAIPAFFSTVVPAVSIHADAVVEAFGFAAPEFLIYRYFIYSLLVLPNLWVMARLAGRTAGTVVVLVLQILFSLAIFSAASEDPGTIAIGQTVLLTLLCLGAATQIYPSGRPGVTTRFGFSVSFFRSDTTRLTVVQYVLVFIMTAFGLILVSVPADCWSRWFLKESECEIRSATQVERSRFRMQKVTREATTTMEDTFGVLEMLRWESDRNSIHGDWDYRRTDFWREGFTDSFFVAVKGPETWRVRSDTAKMVALTSDQAKIWDGPSAPPQDSGIVSLTTVATGPATCPVDGSCVLFTADSSGWRAHDEREDSDPDGTGQVLVVNTDGAAAGAMIVIARLQTGGWRLVRQSVANRYASFLVEGEWHRRLLDSSEEFLEMAVDSFEFRALTESDRVARFGSVLVRGRGPALQDTTAAVLMRISQITRDQLNSGIPPSLRSTASLYTAGKSVEIGHRAVFRAGQGQLAEVYRVSQRWVALTFFGVLVVMAISFLPFARKNASAREDSRSEADRERREASDVEKTEALAVILFLVLLLPILSPVELDRIDVDKPVGSFTNRHWLLPAFVVESFSARTDEMNSLSRVAAKLDQIEKELGEIRAHSVHADSASTDLWNRMSPFYPEIPAGGTATGP